MKHFDIFIYCRAVASKKIFTSRTGHTASEERQKANCGAQMMGEAPN
jgi:hypothetical protein